MQCLNSCFMPLQQVLCNATVHKRWNGFMDKNKLYYRRAGPGLSGRSSGCCVWDHGAGLPLSPTPRCLFQPYSDPNVGHPRVPPHGSNMAFVNIQMILLNRAAMCTSWGSCFLPDHKSVNLWLCWPICSFLKINASWLYSAYPM